MPDYADTLAQLAQARESSKEVLTELRQTIKDAKQAKAEVKDFITNSAVALVVVAINSAIDNQIGELERKLAEEGETMTRRIHSSVDAVSAALDAKEQFLSDLATRVHEAVELITDSTANIKVRLQNVEEAHIHVHQATATHRELITVIEERLNNAWEAIKLLNNINDGLRRQINHIAAELGLTNDPLQ